MYFFDSHTKSIDFEFTNFHIYSPSRAIDVIFRLIFFPCIFWLAKKRLFNYCKPLKDNDGNYTNQTYKTIGLIPINVVKSDYYQSEVLFNKDKLLLTIKDKYIQKATKVFHSLPKDRIKVFIHIRRGDYLSLVYNEKRGVDLPLSYFNNAIDIINEEIDSPYYIFLSDDPEYVEQAFQHIDEEDKYISKNSPVVDLSLMSLCEYGVCSNSTFAWWGSYLMNKKQKVFFPKYWLGWRTKTESHPGIQPSWSIVLDID